MLRLLSLMLFCAITKGQSLPLGGIAQTGGGGSLPALISHVQGPATPASGGGAAAAMNTTGANFLALVITDFAAVTVTDSVTGCSSPCNTWTALTSYPATPGVRMYYAQNPTVGTNHIVTVAGTSSFVSFCVLAFSNMLTSGVFVSGTDQHANGAGSTLQCCSITPPSGHQVVIAGIGVSSTSITLSIDSGMTISDQFAYDPALGWGVGAAYKIQTTGTAIDPTWTLSIATSADANIAAFSGM